MGSLLRQTINYNVLTNKKVYTKIKNKNTQNIKTKNATKS